MQLVTEMEKKTDKFIEKIDVFNTKVNDRIGDDVKVAEIPIHWLKKIPPEVLVDIEREDEEFYNEFNKAISDPLLKEADDVVDSEYGVAD